MLQSKRACCTDEKKAGCCEQGMGCCKNDQACCDKAPKCCVEAKDCCKEGKKCCGAKGKVAAQASACCAAGGACEVAVAPGRQPLAADWCNFVFDGHAVEVNPPRALFLHSALRDQATVAPPSITITWPVTYEASSEARYSAAKPISSGWPR